MCNMRYLPFVLSLVLLFSACSSESKLEKSYPSDQAGGSRFNHGESVFGDSGLSIFGNKKKQQQGNGIGVNAYLWRAALDTVSFMPIQTADPFGGTILTDWHSPGNVTDERLKANIVILDQQLRADSVRVSLFRQTKDVRGNWEDAAVPPDAARKMEDTILTRARQLKVAQEQGNL